MKKGVELAPVVFLDIDGVLNNDEIFRNRRRCENWPEDCIDRACVALLNQLLTRSGAVVVVSSSWRQLLSLEEIERVLRGHGFSGTICDKTPRLFVARGYEIARWREDSGHKGPFVILDDSEDMVHLADRLVLTNMEYGLRQEDVESAISILAKGRDA